MKWEKFSIKKPAHNSYIVASDGKSISLFTYPQEKALYSSCACLMNINDCIYWMYLSDIDVPSCDSCFEQAYHWKTLMNPQAYCSEQNAIAAHKAATGSDVFE